MHDVGRMGHSGAGCLLQFAFRVSASIEHLPRAEWNGANCEGKNCGPQIDRVLNRGMIAFASDSVSSGR